MAKEFSEGLLFDLLEKRRAENFTADEILWAADHMDLVRQVRASHDLKKSMPVVKKIGLLTTYDQSLDLRALIEWAVGPTNLGNINSNITKERFPHKGNGVRSVKMRVEPYLNGETREQAAKRLTAAGHILLNIRDLAGFLHDHPEEVEKWGWVDAISEDSRWTDSDRHVCVPYVRVNGACRNFGLDRFRNPLYSSGGVLVLSE